MFEKLMNELELLEKKIEIIETEIESMEFGEDRACLKYLLTEVYRQHTDLEIKIQEDIHSGE